MRKSAFLLLVALLLLSFDLTAQNNLPPAYELSTDTFLEKVLDKQYWQILEDPKNELTFETVSQAAYMDRFHYDTVKDSMFDFSVNTYWYRYRLRNVMDRDAKICLLTYSEESDYYLLGPNGKYDHKVSGWMVPWRQIEGLKLPSARAIPVVLKPSYELIIYNRVYNSYHFPYFASAPFVGIAVTDKIIAKNYIEVESLHLHGIHNSFFFGIMIFAGLLNFLFFVIVREKVYLYFSLYLLFLGIGRFNEELYHLFLREAPRTYGYLFNLFWLFASFFLVWFTRSLLQSRKNLPRWDKVLVAANIFRLFWKLSAFFFPLFPSLLKFRHPYHVIEILVDIILVCCILLTFFLAGRRNNSENRLVAVAILPALCIWGVLWSVDILYKHLQYFILPQKFVLWLDEWWPLIETICLFWIVSYFAWVLLHRFVELRKQVVKQEFEKEKERSKLIAEQKIELENQVQERTAELKSSLENLKSTQAQLIQSEKMTSLGELTAGIAHEIQNPLNFVNNFSEVNNELINEMQLALRSGNVDEAITVSQGIQQNLEKINLHGKRADSIVKSMMQHSRISTGQKELIDINALVDEYLRLSYHGMRAKDKAFSATLATDFDKQVGQITIVPQDIGRVLLNLYNNAFYSVMEKKKISGQGYEACVAVSTKRINGQVEIKVKDNGIGIPEKVKEKIFQPFFTTKPSGQGTGLGLSLSYDIIAKEHAGQIRVETVEGEGAEFIIQLPV